MKNVFIEFVITFVAAFIATAVVSYLYTLIVHGNGIVSWDTAIQLAIVLGLLIPWKNRRLINKK